MLLILAILLKKKHIRDKGFTSNSKRRYSRHLLCCQRQVLLAPMLKSSVSEVAKCLHTLKHTRSSHKLKAPNRQESRNLNSKYITARGRKKNSNVDAYMNWKRNKKNKRMNPRSLRDYSPTYGKT